MVMINVLDFVQTLCWNIFDHVRIQKFAVGGGGITGIWGCGGEAPALENFVFFWQK